MKVCGMMDSMALRNSTTVVGGATLAIDKPIHGVAAGANQAAQPPGGPGTGAWGRRETGGGETTKPLTKQDRQTKPTRTQWMGTSLDLIRHMWARCR